MSDWTLSPQPTTAIAGIASTQPSTGKTITASVVNDGTSAYVFSGDISGSNPNFTVLRGEKLVLSINASGHPFWIQTSSGAYNASNVVTEHITNNGVESGTLTWTPNLEGTYYYVCQYHSSMNGTITVSNSVFTISPSLGSASVVNIDFSNFDETIPGWLTGRRPQSGQLFPRGVYNK